MALTRYAGEFVESYITYRTQLLGLASTLSGMTTRAHDAALWVGGLRSIERP